LAGALVFVLVWRAHIAHPPGVDAWLSIAGAIVLLMASVVRSADAA